MILFDAKTPKGALPGGMGLAFDWSLLGRISRCLAVGAGRRAKSDELLPRRLRAPETPLVDTSSGVESAPGVKDTEKITNFAFAVRLA